MLNFFRKKPRLFLGVEITSDAVNQLQISGICQDGLIHYEQIPLDPNLFDEHVIVDTLSVAQNIKTLYAKGQFSAQEVVLAIPDALVLTKTLPVSKSLNPAELEAWVAMEVSQWTSYSLNDLYFDFAIQGASAFNSALNTVLIIMTAALPIRSRIKAIEQAGLIVQVVEPESFASARALQILPQEKDSHRLIALGLALRNGSSHAKLH